VLRYVPLVIMKTMRFTLTALLGLAAVVGMRASEKAAPRAEVVFSDPDKFSDAADGPRGSDFGRDGNLDQLRNYILQRANLYVPEGQKLLVTVTDVDLAGEIEPWRGPQFQDTRIVKDIYPPRIDLSFKLVDSSGAVLKEGKRQLRDLTFNMRLVTDRSDPRIYEKGLLDDWLRKDIGRVKK